MRSSGRSVPDNREIAALILFGAAAVWVLSKPKLREGIGGILKSFFQPIIFIPLFAMLAWIGLELWAGSRLGLWSTSLAKGTLLWVLGSAGVLFFNCTQAASDPRFFRRTLHGTIGVAVFVEFFVNLYVLSLPGELVLQVVILVLSLLAAVAALKAEHKPVKILCEVLLAGIGFALFGCTMRQTYLGWEQLDGQTLLLEFALPIWLTAGLLPFLYILSFYIVYDSAFRGVNWATKETGPQWRARLALLSTLHFNAFAVQKFTWNWAKRVTEAPTLRTARRVVAEFIDESRRSEQAKRDEEERIQRYARSNEADAHGRRLDRREFKETASALRSLALYQMGWYRNHGGRYNEDLLAMFRNDFTSDGLPRESGITLKVSADGQSWYGWRRTTTGWRFAIGAAGPPPEQWEYDGAEPPRGFPGQDPAWGERPFSDEASRNWQ